MYWWGGRTTTMYRTFRKRSVRDRCLAGGTAQVNAVGAPSGVTLILPCDTCPFN